MANDSGCKEAAHLRNSTLQKYVGRLFSLVVTVFFVVLIVVSMKIGTVSTAVVSESRLTAN